MASLGYKSSENPLISPNQTRPSPFTIKTSDSLLLSHPKTLPPSFFFFVPLLPGDGRRLKARRRQPPTIIFFVSPSIADSRTHIHFTSHPLLRSSSSICQLLHFSGGRRGGRRRMRQAFPFLLVLQVTSPSTFVFLIVTSLFSLSSLLTVGFFISVEPGGVRRR